MNPKVSILIPVYKAEQYIAECLQSVFEQSYDNIEYILVNDASPDNSIAIATNEINNYPHREPFVKIINNETNKGIAVTRNILISNASGDYIYFVDSDDFIEPNTIETFVETARNEKADIVRCNYFKYYDGQSYPVIRTPYPLSEDILALCLANDNNMQSLCFLFIHRALITKYHLTFPQNINGCEDYLMTIKLFYYTNKVVDIPNTLYYYRLDNTDSITHQAKTFRTHSIQAVMEIVSFLKEKKLDKCYHEQLLLLKFTSKQHFLINRCIRDIDKYINTFPESNSCYKKYNYPYKQKFLFFLAEHKQISLLKFILKFI